jgi:hypothetical protein
VLKLDQNGNVIDVWGFDESSYHPATETAYNVFVGDLSAEDIRINREVEAQKAALARKGTLSLFRNYLTTRKTVQAELDARDAAYYEKLRQDNMARELRQVQAVEAAAEPVTSESRHLVGNLFNRWDAAPRIDDPDSPVVSDIQGDGIEAAESYGKSTWMEGSTGEYESNEKMNINSLPNVLAQMTPVQKKFYIEYLNANKTKTRPVRDDRWGKGQYSGAVQGQHGLLRYRRF